MREKKTAKELNAGDTRNDVTCLQFSSPISNITADHLPIVVFHINHFLKHNKIPEGRYYKSSYPSETGVITKMLSASLRDLFCLCLMVCQADLTKEVEK